jgi:hypothetical protein
MTFGPATVHIQRIRSASVEATIVADQLSPVPEATSIG